MFDATQPPDEVREPPLDPEEIPVEALAALDDGCLDGLVEPSLEDQQMLAQVWAEQEHRAAEDQLCDMDDDTLLEAAAESQRAVNRAQARQLLLAAHWADRHGHLPNRSLVPGRERLVQVGGEGTPEVAEFAAAELGAVLGTSVYAGRHLIADALDLRHRHPRIWERLQRGEVKTWPARQVAAKSRRLSQHAAAKVEAKMVDVIGRVIGSCFDRCLDQAIADADRAAAAQAAHETATRQGVWLGRRNEAGIATLIGKAPLPDLQALGVSLDEIARALTVLGDTDTHQVRRAKALALLANPQSVLDLMRRAQEALDATTDEDTLAGPHDGTDPRRGCDLGHGMLYIHISRDSLTDALNGDESGPARIPDLGPILMEQVRSWLGHRHVTVKPILDIAAIRPVDAHEFPDPLALAVRTTSIADYFPYATNTSGRGDNEHPEPWMSIHDGGPPGQTGLHNAAWTGRNHHRHKTHGAWTPRQLHPGAWLWRSPHGLGYLVDSYGTTPLGKLTDLAGATDRPAMSALRSAACL